MDQQIGRYQILEEVAKGGQGTVYRVFDPDTGQIVALKVLHRFPSNDSTDIERFRREASLAASIDHPNVVKIYEVGQDGDQHFMALEFLPESLARIIEAGGQVTGDIQALDGEEADTASNGKEDKPAKPSEGKSNKAKPKAGKQ